jgi:hypothetical protein
MMREEREREGADQAAVQTCPGRDLVDLAQEDAAERILAVHGCGRKTLREIAVAHETGKQLGGFEQAMKGHDTKPTIMTEAAAQTLGMDPDAFLSFAKKTGVVPKRSLDSRTWSEWDVVAVRRFVRKGHPYAG